MTFTSHTLGGLEPDLIKKLARLTIQNPRSMMREALLVKDKVWTTGRGRWKETHTRKTLPGSKIRICWVEGEPVAWAMIVYGTYQLKRADGFNYAQHPTPTNLMIYVKKAYRGQGIGSKLLDWSRRVTPNQKIMVFAHDKGAKGLYKNCSSTKFIVST